MSRQQLAQALPSSSQQIECSVHGPRQTFQFRSVWLRTDEGAAYVGCRHRRCGCPSRKAFWQWCQRYGVVVVNGVVAKADVDAVLRHGRQCPARRADRHANSLAMGSR